MSIIEVKGKNINKDLVENSLFTASDFSGNEESKFYCEFLKSFYFENDGQ